MTDIKEKTRKNSRKTISLNGLWQCKIAPFTDGIADIGDDFDCNIPVPGLWDMANPSLKFTCDTETIKGNNGEYQKKALWYKKNLRIDSLTESATLKIYKGFYGKEIYVNRHFVCRHEPNFTPCYAEISGFLKAGENEILIKTGEKGTQDFSLGHPVGFDCEKKRFVPGLYDDVELILCDNPKIDYIQVAPDVKNRKVKIQVTITNTCDKKIFSDITYSIKSGNKTIIGTVEKSVEIYPSDTVKKTVELPLNDFIEWTPENPFLYHAEARTCGDELSCKFGMRDFEFENKIPKLNGKTYYLRGTNVVIFRFFEDEKRGNLPWNREWVRKLLLKFKSLNMNSLRFHVGFAPDFWYDLCDEIGLLVDDEYPLFGAYECPVPAYSLNLLNEFKDWINERANHPCVFLWDAQNEIANEPDNGFTVDTIPLIKGAKYEDLSDRLWDNGWDYPESDACSVEVHPYLFLDSNFRLRNLNNTHKDPARTYLCPDWHNLEKRKEQNPFPNNARIVNEYSWLWISREGKPCRLTKDLYSKIFPDGFTERELRDFYAKAVAMLTEFWRAGRYVAGIFEFCGLSYSCESGETSDNFLPDIENPEYDGEFFKRMFCAFSPVGVIIDDYADTVKRGNRVVNVVLVNDLSKTFESELTVELYADGEKMFSASKIVKLSDGEKRTEKFVVPFTVNADYRLMAYYISNDKKIFSERNYKIGNEQSVGLLDKRVVSYNAEIIASSTYHGLKCRMLRPENLIRDGEKEMWSSDFSDGQFVIIDLLSKYYISDIEIVWENGAKEYAVLVSDDGKDFRKVYGVEEYEYGKVQYTINERARFVKLDLKKRLSDNYGFGIWSVKLYGELI